MHIQERVWAPTRDDADTLADHGDTMIPSEIAKERKESLIR